MKIGLLITTDQHVDHITGLVKSATNKGHEVTLFCMDKGTKSVEQPQFTQLCKLPNVIISLCQHSAEEYAVDTGNLSKDIVCGSQFNNAMMNHDVDKMVVF